MMSTADTTSTAQERELLEAARRGDEDAYARLVGPHRSELHAHCYRMLGSVHDAEDALQDALLRAWRGLKRFEGRSSLRSWLYRIATNTCLDVIGRRPKRVLPIDYGPAADPHQAPGEPLVESVWVEPYPDETLGLEDGLAAPEARYEQREAIQLSFIVALQQLPARQRAALVLRDVLGFQTDEAASILETTQQSVKAALQRARATLDSYTVEREQAPLPDSPTERNLLAGFSDAVEAGDTARLLTLLSSDARVTMPPIPGELVGLEAIRAYFDHGAEARGAPLQLRPTRANGQPAFGCYLRSQPWGMMVLALSGSNVDGITLFADPTLPGRFGLPDHT